MEEPDQKGRLALERSLQKAMRVIQLSNTCLQSLITESEPIMISIANLLEQFECCAAVDCDTLPFGATFPDLKGRVLSKIKDEIMGKVEELETLMEGLRERQEAVSKVCETSWALVDRYRPTLDFAALCVASPSFSLAHMLEGLETVDTLIHQIYYSKTHVLEGVVAGTGVTADTLMTVWTDQDGEVTDSITDYLTQLELFTGDKR